MGARLSPLLQQLSQALDVRALQCAHARLAGQATVWLSYRVVTME